MIRLLGIRTDWSAAVQRFRLWTARSTGGSRRSSITLFALHTCSQVSYDLQCHAVHPSYLFTSQLRPTVSRRSPFIPVHKSATTYSVTPFALHTCSLVSYDLQCRPVRPSYLLTSQLQPTVGGVA